jgi:hypothetical protein
MPNTASQRMAAFGGAGLVALSLLGMGGLAAYVGEAQAQLEMTKEILAVQLRKQGFECASPQSAERDAKDSQPNETVWIVKCENAAYRMRVVPDIAAAIEKLPDDAK